MLEYVPYMGSYGKLGFPRWRYWYCLPANAGDARDLGSVPVLGRPIRVGSGHWLWYSCLKNSVDRGALWATVHWVTESWTQLSTHTHHWNPKHAKVFPIPSRCFLLPKTRKGEHLSRESQVTKFSSPVSTLLKSWVPILEETSSWKGVFSNYILITSYTNLYQNFLDWQAE